MATDASMDAVQGNQEENTPKKHKKKKLTRAEKMQLKLKRERDFKMLEIRHQLRREHELSKRTARKYREHWESMCREVKLKEMKQELQDWEEQVNRVLKQKDEKIELLLDEMATTEDFHRKSFSTNVQAMDYLLDTLKAFQKASYLLYEKEASELLHDFYREVDERNRHDNRMKAKCENTAISTNLLTEQELLADYKQFLDKRDDCVNEEIFKRYRLRDSILKQMKCLREQLLEFLHSLKNVSLDAQKYEKINSLVERQKTFQTESLRLNNAEERSNQIYEQLQIELAQEEKETKRKLNGLQEEYAYFMRMRKKIENDMKHNAEETHEMLKIIASESYEIKKKYQKLQKYGELLLSLAINCRKFQTEAEKVLPRGDFSDPNTENPSDVAPYQLQIIDLKKHVDISEQELQNNAQLMSNFWRRQAVAEAQVVLLEEEKKNLLRENQNYIDKIKRLSKADNAEDLQEAINIKSAEEYRF